MWREQWIKQQAFLTGLTDEAVNAPLSYHDQFGTAHTQLLSQLMAHMVNHGTQFRAEAAVRLTQLGVSPGDLDLIIYIRQLPHA
jgi:uncharacterized damage-inducible protein DinB